MRWSPADKTLKTRQNVVWAPALRLRLQKAAEMQMAKGPRTSNGSTAKGVIHSGRE